MAKEHPLRTAVLEMTDGDQPLAFCDGMDSAIIGLARRFNDTVVAYDYDACVRCLMRQGMDRETALEWMETQCIGASLGNQTPVFLHFTLKRTATRKKNCSYKA